MEITYNQVARIIEPPHLLYTGSNGKKTYGITLETVTPEGERVRGYSSRWSINDYTILNLPKNKLMQQLGLSESEYNELIQKTKELKETATK